MSGLAGGQTQAAVTFVTNSKYGIMNDMSRFLVLTRGLTYAVYFIPTNVTMT